MEDLLMCEYCGDDVEDGIIDGEEFFCFDCG